MDLKALIQKIDTLDKKQNLMESQGRELGNTPRDNLIKRLSPTTWDNDTLMKAVKKAVNSPDFTSDFILKIVDAGDSIRHPLGKFIQQEFDELQYDMGRKYEDYPEEVAERLIMNLKQMSSSVSENQFKSSIAQELLKEFGLDEAAPQNPWANDPEKSAAWAALTPEDQAWLGGADPTDTNILRRAPNKGQPAPQTATPQNATQAAQDAEIDQVSGEFDQMNQQAAMDKELDAATAQADANQANAVAGQPEAPVAGKPAIDPAKVARFKELLAKAGK
jgi:hypothetical protein